MSTDNTPLGDRMKMYENVTRRSLPRRTFSLIRVDGKAFHSHLRGAERPYDPTVVKAMDQVAAELVMVVSGSVFAYVQSDEVSLLVQDFATLNQEPWFGGVEAKLVSVTASIATAVFNCYYQRADRAWALFDSRVWTMADEVEVANYFLWRQQDATRNSVAMSAQTWFTSKKLHGVNVEWQKAMLREIGQDWENNPDGFKRGRVAFRGGDAGGVIVSAAPEFKAEPGNWLVEMIPSMQGFQRG